MSQIDFITNAPGLFSTLSPDQKPVWGKMNAQQVVEHLSDFFRLSTGEIEFPLSVPEEHLPKFREFLFSEKMFRENTKAPSNVMPEEPAEIRNSDFESAISELKNAVLSFEHYFIDNPEATTLHPAFGPLDKHGWLTLHYKHTHHHLRQFGLL